MIDVFIGITIFAVGVITGAIFPRVIHEPEKEIAVTKPKIREFAEAENDNPLEEDKDVKKKREESRTFYS